MSHTGSITNDLNGYQLITYAVELLLPKPRMYQINTSELGKKIPKKYKMYVEVFQNNVSFYKIRIYIQLNTVILLLFGVLTLKIFRFLFH